MALCDEGGFKRVKLGTRQPWLSNFNLTPARFPGIPSSMSLRSLSGVSLLTRLEYCVLNATPTRVLSQVSNPGQGGDKSIAGKPIHRLKNNTSLISLM